MVPQELGILSYLLGLGLSLLLRLWGRRHQTIWVVLLVILLLASSLSSWTQDPLVDAESSLRATILCIQRLLLACGLMTGAVLRGPSVRSSLNKLFITF
jgi:hypothetical protein